MHRPGPCSLEIEISNKIMLPEENPAQYLFQNVRFTINFSHFLCWRRAISYGYMDEGLIQDGIQNGTIFWVFGSFTFRRSRKALETWPWTSMKPECTDREDEPRAGKIVKHFIYSFTPISVLLVEIGIFTISLIIISLMIFMVGIGHIRPRHKNSTRLGNTRLSQRK